VSAQFGNVQNKIKEILPPCEVCGFGLWHPIVGLTISSLGLYSDDRYPGRCILSYTGSHAEQITDLADIDATSLMTDLRTAVTAIQQVTGCARVNVAFLSNTVPHLHAHLIPRHPDSEPTPQRPIWDDPRPRRDLAPLDVNGLTMAIRKAIVTHR